MSDQSDAKKVVKLTAETPSGHETPHDEALHVKWLDGKTIRMREREDGVYERPAGDGKATQDFAEAVRGLSGVQLADKPPATQKEISKRVKVDLSGLADAEAEVISEQHHAKRADSVTEVAAEEVPQKEVRYATQPKSPISRVTKKNSFVEFSELEAGPRER